MLFGRIKSHEINTQHRFMKVKWISPANNRRFAEHSRFAQRYLNCVVWGWPDGFYHLLALVKLNACSCTRHPKPQSHLHHHVLPEWYMFEVFNEQAKPRGWKYVHFMCVFTSSMLVGLVVRKRHCYAANIYPMRCDPTRLQKQKPSTSDALFVFVKNNLFALIKFVSINKYFTSKQAMAAAKTNRKHILVAFRHFRSSIRFRVKSLLCNCTLLNISIKRNDCGSFIHKILLLWLWIALKYSPTHSHPQAQTEFLAALFSRCTKSLYSMQINLSALYFMLIFFGIKGTVGEGVWALKKLLETGTVWIPLLQLFVHFSFSRYSSNMWNVTKTNNGIREANGKIIFHQETIN